MKQLLWSFLANFISNWQICWRISAWGLNHSFIILYMTSVSSTASHAVNNYLFCSCWRGRLRVCGVSNNVHYVDFKSLLYRLIPALKLFTLGIKMLSPSYKRHTKKYHKNTFWLLLGKLEIISMYYLFFIHLLSMCQCIWQF